LDDEAIDANGAGDEDEGSDEEGSDLGSFINDEEMSGGESEHMGMVHTPSPLPYRKRAAGET